MASEFERALAAHTAPGTSSNEVAKPEPAPSSDVVAVNIHTGEVSTDLSTESLDWLVETAEALVHATKWQRALNAEIKARVADDRPVQLDGFEVRVITKHGREWDADALEALAKELAAELEISASDVVGLVTKKVDGTKANSIRNRLTGSALERWQDCSTSKPTREVKIARVPNLADALPKGDTDA